MLTTNQRDILAGIIVLVKLIEKTLKADDGEVIGDARSIIELYLSWRNAFEIVGVAMERENDADINTDSVD